ncbi:hypothetical protein Lepto7376_3677 [[Leptolyngbya] sp. PCC 7376]|uniref:hypothetical protein n=1 Tax=[Leptolyngbya] sp. PCC 7376 TaxID=111781 RepID=UPI00029EE9CC|nr:hypothetical protein [[Leptolyngbya] sp. PCC 7376]AFY39853.1 hypothetical protein Lepto7376_3677 [[Leptolyngbya] sp. PCC 7376]
MKFETIRGKFSIQIPGNLLEDVPTKAAFILRSQTWRSLYKNRIYGAEYCLIDNVKQPSEIPALLELMTNTIKDGYFIEGGLFSKTLFKKGSVDCLKSIIFGRPNADMHESFEKYNLPIESNLVYRIDITCCQRNRIVKAYMTTTDQEQLKLGKKYLRTLQLKF